MKWMWCWRCREEVPMLNDDEYAVANELFGKGFRTPGKTMTERFKDVIEFYFELTGERYSNANAIMHHAQSFYGPPCEVCGKPYRTVKANFCAACGHKQ